MLIIVPPSDTQQAPPEDGEPVRLEDLSFPVLNATRSRILDALVETSAGPDAFSRLYAKPSMAGDLARNTRLRELPTRPAAEVYAGPLHRALDATTLPEDARERAARRLVITSALWGALRPDDPIPPYRLDVCSRLVGLDRLEPTWRTIMPEVLAGAADDGVILDLRSQGFQAIGMPAGLGDRTVTLKVRQRVDGGFIGDVVAKRARGQAARQLLETGADPGDPDQLADALAERWPVELEPPVRPGRAWTLRLTLDD
jgi:uncharacterized protein